MPPSMPPEEPLEKVVKISTQRWIHELFAKTCFLFDVTQDVGLGVCARLKKKSGQERSLPSYWQKRVHFSLRIGKETYRWLGVLGVWGLKYEFQEGKGQLHSQGHRIGSLITGGIWKLPDALVEMGYSLSEDRQQKPVVIDLDVPNGIYLELHRESEQKQMRFGSLIHEAIINVNRLMPLQFGSETQRIRVKLQPECVEKLASFSSIHQIHEKDALLLILGQYFFVGEKTGGFIRNEEGQASELWL